MSSTRITRRVNAPRAAVYRALRDARAVATDGAERHDQRIACVRGPRRGFFRISLTYDEPAGTARRESLAKLAALVEARE